MQTKLIRIDLTTIPPATSDNPAPLEKMINDDSVAQKSAGLVLVSTFVFGTDLILVFQKQS